jgi:hypothetical protein
MHGDLSSEIIYKQYFNSKEEMYLEMRHYCNVLFSLCKLKNQNILICALLEDLFGSQIFSVTVSLVL